MRVIHSDLRRKINSSSPRHARREENKLKKNKKKLGTKETDNHNSRLEGFLHLLSTDGHIVRVDSPAR